VYVTNTPYVLTTLLIGPLPPTKKIKKKTHPFLFLFFFKMTPLIFNCNEVDIPFGQRRTIPLEFTNIRIVEKMRFS